MLFYEAEVKFKNDEWVEQNYVFNDYRQSRSMADELKNSFEKFSKNIKNALYIFIGFINKKSITFGICVDSKEDIKEIVNRAIKYLEVDADKISIEEITFSRFNNMLSHAENACFIEDDKEVLKKLDLSKMNRYSHCMFDERLEKELKYIQKRKFKS